MTDRHNKWGSVSEDSSDEGKPALSINQRTPPQLPPQAQAAVASPTDPSDRHEKAAHGIFWDGFDNIDEAPPLQPNQAGNGNVPIITNPADIINGGNLKDLATLEDRHGLNLDGVLLNAFNGGQTQFTPEPTDTPTEAPTVSMMPTPANETDSPTEEPTITMMPTTDEPTLTRQPTTTIAPTTTKAPTISPQPTITQKPTTTMSPTVSPKPTVTQQPTFTQSPTFTMMPTEQGPTPRPTPAPTGRPTQSPTSQCFSTKKSQGNFGNVEAEGSLITVPYRYEVELLPDGTPPIMIQEVERPDGWGWGSSGGTAEEGAASPFRAATLGTHGGEGGGGRRRMAVPQDLLTNLINVENLGSGVDEPSMHRRIQDDGGATQPTPEAISAVATLTNEILPQLEIRISDSLLPIAFEDECGQFGTNRRKRARYLQQQVDVLGLTAAPPDSPNLQDQCQIIIPEDDNTCTVVDGALRLRVAGNVTDIPATLKQDIFDTIRDGMGPTGTYRLVDGRIVRLAYAPGNIPASQGDTIVKGTDGSSIPAYPFVIVALFIAAMIGALVFYRKRHLNRDMQMYDEDGNPLGSAYDDSGYAPPGDDMNMIEGEDGYNDFDEYGDSFAGSQQPGNQYLEDDQYGDGGDGYADDGYGDDGYNDGGGGFDTIEEGNEDDWGKYGVNENESQMQQSQDEYSNQW